MSVSHLSAMALPNTGLANKRCNVSNVVVLSILRYIYLYFCILYFIFASVFVVNKRKCIFGNGNEKATRQLQFELDIMAYKLLGECTVFLDPAPGAQSELRSCLSRPLQSGGHEFNKAYQRLYQCSHSMIDQQRRKRSLFGWIMYTCCTADRQGQIGSCRPFWPARQQEQSNNNNNNNNNHFKRPLTNVTKARAVTRIPWPIHICQSEQKRFQHLPKGSQCDCRITKRSW